MRQYKFGSALLMTMILVGCGGGGDDVPAKPKFTAQVSFGDSLSDVGSYKVGKVAADGGGQFTINVPGTTPTNWTQMTAGKLGLPPPCAAQKGLNDGTGIASDTNVAVTNDAACTGYGQGGAMVTNPIGVRNADPSNKDKGMQEDALTLPVVEQINNHLAAHGGSFTGGEIVLVMAGANDVLMQLGNLKAAVTVAIRNAVPAQIAADIASGACVPTDAQASNCVDAAVATLTPTVGAQTLIAYLTANTATANLAMEAAANELVAAVDTKILAKNAKYVTVINVPDITTTPFAATQNAPTKAFLAGLVTAFNNRLKIGLDALPGKSNVLFVDANTASHDETQNPAKYNLANVADTACNLTKPTPNSRESSLICNLSNLATGVTPTNMGGYLFADTVHPTPYGHLLFATYVLQAMTNKGWY